MTFDIIRLSLMVTEHGRRELRRQRLSVERVTKGSAFLPKGKVISLKKLGEVNTGYVRADVLSLVYREVYVKDVDEKTALEVLRAQVDAEVQRRSEIAVAMFNAEEKEV